MLRKVQSGFTLIELVIVIIILGILSVTAAPKFLDLQGDAKAATLDAIAGAMKTASDTIHAKSLIAGTDVAATSTVALSNGQTVAIAYGYPAHDWDTAWDEMLDAEITVGSATVACASDFCYIASHDITGETSLTVTDSDATTALIIVPKGKTSANECYVYYAFDEGQTGALDKPEIGVVKDKC
jgi:MSHA pilin protein MshA